MVAGTRNMHVLCVVCYHLAVLTQNVMAYPTGEYGGSDPLAYSPSYDFIDEYLRHSDEDLTPSDSELGDLIWDLLYRPDPQTLPWKRDAPGLKRQQSWPVDNGRQRYTSYDKRQQGWYTDYGKRQQGWHSDYGKRQQGWHSDYGKRQQGWHSDYGKRQQGWNADYASQNEYDASPREVSLNDIYNTLFQGWRPTYRKRQQGWHVGYGKRESDGDVITGYVEPSAYDHSLEWELDLQPYIPSLATLNVPVAQKQDESSGYEAMEQGVRRRQLEWDEKQKRLYETKRQQGWHTPYGKRLTRWLALYDSR
ncbi:uncharacterized protein LOC124149760 [Haliotis rufescens]|uniref:uncharacterized protein LOC124149760 n=1 Tax=Haliotis rufescens TaxID=6454 RepID=UPI00201F3021|nr:uncharacterized protein LOC124149760 [Haliotis rufescens]